MGKFTDEELSRILSAHANGELRRYGYCYGALSPKCCLLQAAYTVNGYFSGKGEPADIRWFDETYNAGWPLGKFLRELEKQGLA